MRKLTSSGNGRKQYKRNMYWNPSALCFGCIKMSTRIAKKTNQPCNFGWVHPFQKEVSSLSVITCQLFGWFWFGFKAYRFSVLSFIHSHWVMHLQKSCAAAELLWLHLCSRQEVCLSLPCTWLRCWIMFSMRHCFAISLLECSMAWSSFFHWIQLSLIFFQ